MTAAATRSFTIDSLNHIVLWVSDLERSERFYRDVLGLQVRRKSERGVFFTCGTNDHDVAIFAAGADAAPAEERRVGLYHFALRLGSLEELKAAYRHLKASDANIAGFAHHGDTKSIYVKDPDGLEIEIFCECEDEPGGNEAKLRAGLGAD